MKIFSPALKRQMKECMLAIFWPKKSVYAFFKDCSVPAPALKSIQYWDAMGLSRAAMIDQVFDHLSSQHDSGTMHFTLMLEELSSWSHFDEYWFVTQQKLDIVVAQKKIAALQSAKASHVDRAKRSAEGQRAKMTEREQRHTSLEDMRQDFRIVSMESETEQARGYALEKFMAKMARFYGLQVAEPFRVKGTQIDGTIKYEGENYNIEAKWHRNYLSDEPILAFCRKLEINMHGRGLYLSINGYTAGALAILERTNNKNIVLMDGEDIALMLTELTTFPDALNTKIHAAQTRGQFYIHPITNRSKISA